MLPVPDASLPAVEICSERSAAGKYMLRSFDVVVGKEDNLQPIAYSEIVVDECSDGIDQLDDQFRHKIPGRGLAAEDERARGEISVRIAFEAQIECEDVQDIQVLSFLFVNPL
jgi:hypothetical protein